MAARAEIGTQASIELLAWLDAVTTTRRARAAESSRGMPSLSVLTLVAAGLALRPLEPTWHQIVGWARSAMEP